MMASPFSKIPPEEDLPESKVAVKIATPEKTEVHHSAQTSGLHTVGSSQIVMSTLPVSKYSAMRALLLTLGKLFGEPPEHLAENMDKSFYELGGTSQNSLLAIIYLQHHKYKIDVLDFLGAKNLKDIVMKMSQAGERSSSVGWATLEKSFKHKRMKRRDLEFLFQCFDTENIRLDKLPEDWNELWRSTIAKGMQSREDKSPVGAVLNFDINDDTHNKLVAAITGRTFTVSDLQKYSYKMSSKSVLIELLQFIGENSHKKGKVLHPMFFIKEGLKDPDCVAVMILMEVLNFNYARKKKFNWLVSSYPRLLQAQVEKQIMGFEVLLEDNIDCHSLFDQYRYVFGAKKI